MQKSKTHFEVIPIESVKKILEQQKEKQEREKELAEKKESGNGT